MTRLHSTSLLVLLLCALALAACTEPTGPDDTPAPDATTVVVSKLGDRPASGGDVTSMETLADGRVVAVIDRRLHTMNPATATMELVNGDPVHATVEIGPNGLVHVYSDTTFRTYDLADGSFVDHRQSQGTPFTLEQRRSIAQVAAAPNGDLYVVVAGYPSSVFYTSQDGGATWQHMTSTSSFGYDGRFAFLPNGDIVVSNNVAFYVSTDRGATWMKHSSAQQGYAGSMVVTGDGAIYHYVPNGGGLRVSRDRGASWTDLTQFNRAPFWVDLREGDAGALYALAGIGPARPEVLPQTELMRSTDGGVTWSVMFQAAARTLAVDGSTMMLGLAELGSAAATKSGGVLTSRDAGATWTVRGTKVVENIIDVGFDRNGNLMLFADGGLYRKISAGWQVLGISPGQWSRFASTPQGSFLLASVGGVWFSNDDGATWKYSEIADYIGGPNGMSQVTVLLPRRRDEFILSLTTYSNTSGHGSGRLYRVTSTGTLQSVTGMGSTISAMVEDPNGILYGIEEYLTFGNTYDLRYHTSIDGREWESTKERVRGMAFNSQRRFLAHGELGTLLLGTQGMTTETKLTLEGFTSQSNYIRRAYFGPDDRLYLLTSDQGLFISSAPVR